ncbi:MAG: prepilin-type N-terminal cleavage/methylation domain-containing protein [Patescibacteria group bacterium]
MTGKLNNKGFSLIEVLVSMMIFLVIFIIVMDLTVLFTQHPEKIIRRKKLEGEMSYTMEFMAQKIRTNKINYALYSSPVGLSNITLYLIDSDGNQTRLSKSSTQTNIYYYPSSGGSQAINSTDIVIDSISFRIYPLSNPYCDNFSTGSYVACSFNEQPRVIINMVAHHALDKSIKQVLQTAVVSRIYER